MSNNREKLAPFRSVALMRQFILSNETFQGDISENKIVN